MLIDLQDFGIPVGVEADAVDSLSVCLKEPRFNAIYVVGGNYKLQINLRGGQTLCYTLYQSLPEPISIYKGGKYQQKDYARALAAVKSLMVRSRQQLQRHIAAARSEELEKFA